MTPETLWRKLQKKKKRKYFRKCPKCGYRMICRLGYLEGEEYPRLFAVCEKWGIPIGGRKGGCGYRKELFWKNGSSAGIGRQIPH